MRKIYSLTIVAGVLASFIACDKADEDKLLRESSICESAQTGYSAYIAEPCDGLLPDGIPSTKAISSDFKFSFSTGDKFNVFPDTFGASLIYALNPDESDNKKAECTPEDVTMEDGTWYAVYPSVDVSNIKGNIVTLSFTGQKQSRNGNSDHLAKYDYNWAQAEVNDNKGTFEFSHKVSWLKITLTNIANNNRTFSSINILASEGIAEAANLDVSTGVMTSTRSYGDNLVLSLNNIQISKNGSLTAYVTIPSDTYTNLTIKTSDNNGRNYGYQVNGAKTLEAGKYYSVTLSQQTVPDPERPAAFTDLTQYGSYKNTDSAPEADFTYTTPNDQISYGTATNSRTCKIFNIENNEYNIFTIGTNNLTLNSNYSVRLNSSVSARDNEGTFTVTKLTESSVWLEDKTNHIGYILPIE